MAKEKPKQYEDALGSIYDFIFAETKKSPAKVKPVKVTGVDGTSEFADALIATLENPLLFVNKSTMDAFEEVVNYDLLTLRYGAGERDRVKFNAKDIPKALKDPTGFLDKAFAKYEANRKVNKAVWAGDQIQGILGGLWARKHGLDRETVLAMSKLHRGSDRFKQSANFDPTEVAGMGERTGKLIDKHLINPDKSYTLVDFIERYGSEAEAKKKFAQYKNWMKKAQDPKGRRSLIYDKEVYAFLEGQDIRDKAVEAENAGDMLKAQNYYRSRRYLDSSLSNEQRKVNEQRNNIEIRKYKNEISRLKSSNDPNKKAKIRALEKEIRSIYADRKISRVTRIAGLIGGGDGFWSSLKATAQIQAGDLFITGEFFDPSNKSWLNPIDIEANKTLSEGGVRGFSKININGQDIKFKIAKTSRSRYAQNFNEQFLKFYYRTPVVRIRSLFNGEYYAYKIYENMNKFQKKFGSKISGFDMAKLYNDKGEIDDIYMQSILASMSTEQAEALAKFIKNNERLSNLTYRFATVKRWQDKVSGYFDSKIGKKSREKIANLLLQNSAFKKFAKEILEEWVERGGVQVLGKAIGATLSGVLGPIGMVLGDQIAGVVMKAGQKIAKPAMKITVQGLIFGTIGVLVIVALFFRFILKSSAFLSVNSHIAPAQVVNCDGSTSVTTDGRGIDPILDSEWGDSKDPSAPRGPIAPFVGGALPSGVSCLLGAGAHTCTQGVYGSYSHANVPAIDIGMGGYFYAPSFCGNGNCTVTYMGDVNCAAGYAGGMLKFTASYGGNNYEFKLIHVDSPYTAGTQVGAGEAVARIMTHQETGSACSSGMHLHLETKFNGASVDPRELLVAPSSQGGFGCTISACP